jgi:glycine/D-amino acid oxidase-like deaminating enzyme
MNRRTFLTTGGLAALGFAASGCATRPRAAPTPSRAPVRLVPVLASWDRIIRTTVGLRPHRDAGFVLRAERLDDKTLIHNYGHGGSGMSISWGTGAMAADMALDAQGRRAAVIGCGVVGLTAARQLQRRGFDVTIYAMAVHPNVTSSMSLAGFTPTSGLVEPDRRTPEFDAQFRRAADIAYRQLQLLAGPSYGITWINQYAPTQEIRPQVNAEQARPDRAQVNPAPAQVNPAAAQVNPALVSLDAGLQTDRVVLQPGQHPFPTKYAIQRTNMRIEPSIYLETLMRDVSSFGGRIVIKTFDTPRDLMALPEPVIVNCSGLGSFDLFGDKELMPVKGQLTVLVPQAEVNYQTSGGVNVPSTPGIGIHMMPRSDGIVLGGTAQRGIWTMEPDETERKRVVDGHIELFSRMRPLRSA